MIKNLLAILFLLASNLSLAAEKTYISIIIDDIGNNAQASRKTLSLPSEVTIAILPHTPFSINSAEIAHAQNREILLHVPMEAENIIQTDPGLLTSKMEQQDFSAQLNKNIAAVPHIIGINNHRGSLLTQDKQSMLLTMQNIQQHDLFFVDSRTSKNTVAESMAQQQGIPNIRRDVFLDNVQTTEAIDKQFQQLIRLAKRNGHAVAIGHPFKETINYLNKNLPKLKSQQIELVPISQLLNTETAQENSSEQTMVGEY